MKRQLLSMLLLAAGTAISNAAEFEAPVRLKAGGAYIRVESPGFAGPCWANMKGKNQLLVGQFNQGKIQVFEHLGGEHFAPGKWLEAEGAVAEVPGVW